MTYMNVNLSYYECWVCSVPFAMSRRHAQTRREDGKVFFCPNGCRLSFGEGDVDRLTRERDEKQKKLDSMRERLDSFKRALNDALEQYRCPECPKTYKQRKAFLRHIRVTHKAPLKLAKDAGPNAFNSKVN